MIGQIVELTESLLIKPNIYIKILGCTKYPIGQKFMVVLDYGLERPDSYERYGLKLIIDGVVIEQKGRGDGCTVSIPESSFRIPYVSKKLKLHQALQSGAYTKDFT